MEELYRTDEKVKTSTKWFFALGDIFQGGYFNIVNFFYSIFLTDVVGISPIWAANVFLLGKIWDAVTDPAMGIITDNTRSRFGRRRPFILAGAPLILITFVMMWYPLSSGSETAKIIKIPISLMRLFCTPVRRSPCVRMFPTIKNTSNKHNKPC